jgi:hypothetical protein
VQYPDLALRGTSSTDRDRCGTNGEGAFDGDLNTAWCPGRGHHWVQVQLPQVTNITDITVYRAAPGKQAYNTSTFTLEYRVNGGAWATFAGTDSCDTSYEAFRSPLDRFAIADTVRLSVVSGEEDLTPQGAPCVIEPPRLRRPGEICRAHPEPAGAYEVQIYGVPCGGPACGSSCCGQGEECADAATGTCRCAAGGQACGDAMCCPPGQTCAATSPAPLCCSPGESSCGGSCCQNGWCQAGNVCCPPGAPICNGGVCCANGSCSNQGCCSGGVDADGDCCGGFGTTSCNGQCCEGRCTTSGACCPTGSTACGTACCDPASVCSDPSTSTCTTVCAAGQVVLIDRNVPSGTATVCCDAGTHEACSGGCCGPGTECCGEPVVCQPNSSCAL